MAEQRPDRQPRKPVRPPTGPGGMKFGRGVFGSVLFIGLAIMLFILLKQQQSNTQDIAWSELKEKLSNGQVRTLMIESDQLIGELNSSGKFKTPVQQSMVDFNMLQWL